MIGLSAKDSEGNQYIFQIGCVEAIEPFSTMLLTNGFKLTGVKEYDGIVPRTSAEKERAENVIQMLMDKRGNA